MSKSVNSIALDIDDSVKIPVFFTEKEKEYLYRDNLLLTCSDFELESLKKMIKNPNRKVAKIFFGAEIEDEIGLVAFVEQLKKV